MTVAVWIFIVRCAIAASYLTLALAESNVAHDLIVPYACLVALVAIWDLLSDISSDARRLRVPPP